MSRFKTGILIVLFASTTLAELPVDAVGKIERLPPSYPDTWVYAHDTNFYALADGKVVIVDVASENHNYKGSLGVGQFGSFLPSSTRSELYAAETFYSRRLRGERTDVITIYDKENLSPIDEIVLPGGKRGQLVTYKGTLQFLNNEKFLLLFNFSPATSVSVIDIDQRKIVSEVQIPGCSMIYPTAKLSFASLCSDDVMLISSLNKDGTIKNQKRSKKFFSGDKDPIFAFNAMIGDIAYFPSFMGQVQAIDMSSETPKILKSKNGILITAEEFRLHGETVNLKWVVGAYYLRIEGDFRSGIDIRGSNGTLFDNRYSNETESYAFFGQGEYAINDQFSFTAGIRWTQDKKTMVNNPSCDSTVADIALTGGGGIPTDCTFVPLTFPILLPGVTVQELGFNGSQSEGDYALKLGLDWRPNEDWLVYASATRGNKAGAFNGGAVALYTPAQAAFGSEVLWAYETGFKATLWGGKAIFNSTAFYYDYNDFQTFTQLGPSLTVFNIDAEVLGAEFELIANPFEGLEFSFGVSLLDAEVRDLAYGDGGGPNAPPAFIQNAPMTNSPDLTLNGLARYEWPMLQGKMALQMDFNWVDDRNLNAVPHPSLRAEDYVLINARLTYTWGQNDNWYMALWVENLTDEYYVPTAFDLTGFTGSTIDIPGRPRWIGGTIGMSWE